MTQDEWPASYLSNQGVHLPEHLAMHLSPAATLGAQRLACSDLPQLVTRQHVIDKLQSTRQLLALNLIAGYGVGTDTLAVLRGVDSVSLPDEDDQLNPRAQDMLKALYNEINTIQVKLHELLATSLPTKRNLSQHTVAQDCPAARFPAHLVEDIGWWALRTRK